MTYTHFTIQEKDSLQYMLNLIHPPKVTEIAKAFNKDESSIYREIKKGDKYGKYNSSESKKQSREKRLKANQRFNKILNNAELKKYILKYLKKHWSPDEIANRWNLETNNTYHVGYVTVYHYVYARKELWKYLRHKKNKYRRRYGTNIRIESRQKDTNKKRIQDRPEEANLRIESGHLEGDTVVLEPRTTCLLTHVDRKDRYTFIDLLPNHEKETIRKQTEKTLKNTQTQTITYDNGTSFNDYEKTERHLGIKIYFADTYASWERGTNENTNGLIREFFPKGTRYDTISKSKVKKVEKLLNTRPKKCLNYLTPYEVRNNIFCRTLD